MFISTSGDLRPLTTAHLAQTMFLLEKSTAELAETVASELSENPALELVDERRCPNCNRELHQQAHCPLCLAHDGTDTPIVYLAARDLSTSSRKEFDDAQADRPEPEAQEQLGEHLLRQIGPDLVPSERGVAAYLIARLDDDGFLPEAPAESAAYLHVPLATVQRILGFIQRADPPGMGTADSRHSLLVQLDVLAGDMAVPPLARQIILECWQALGKLDYVHISRQLRAPRAAVTQAAQFIARNLTPYPARAFWGATNGRPRRQQEAYGQPDVAISRSPNHTDGPLVVEVFTPYSGWLRVNPEFRSALRQCQPEEREDWSRYLQRASLFAKCIQQRNHTMRRLMDAVVRAQRGFILHGDRHLAPMTRAALSRQLGVHESTISRAVASKTVSLPDGQIVPLSKFFDRSLSVRDAVKSIVAKETRALTDDQIVLRLREENIHIARRTVAKYRATEGILPAQIRARLQAAAP